MMEQFTARNPATRILNGVAAFVIIIAGMKASTGIVVPFLLSIFIAILASSPLFWLRRKGWPVGLALAAILLAIVGAMLLLGVLLGASLDGFSRALPSYQERLRDLISAAVTWAQAHGMDVSVERAREAFDPAKAVGMANNILSALGNLLGNAFLILFTVAFMLLEAATFPGKLLRIVGDTELTAPRQILDGVRRYIGVKSITSAATGICIGILTFLLGIDFPFLWAILGFLLNFVPTIGSIIAAVPAVLVALVQLGVGPAAMAALGYAVINVTFGNIIEPRVMGRVMGLSTLVVFLSLVFWGWVLGPIGMLLSVPLTMVAKIAFEQNEKTQPIAILLGTEREAQTEPVER
jgi:predicted PurR-regulated permease PerM